MKYLKATHKNEYRSVVNTYNLTYSDVIFSNYTKQIDIDDYFNFIRNNIIITNSVRMIISDMNYTKKCIQPTNSLKIHTFNFGTVLCEHIFLKYKSACIMTNIVYQHTLKFGKKKLHTKNIFLIEQLCKCKYNLISNNRKNIIIFKNIKNINIHYDNSHMHVYTLILKNIYCLLLNFSCIDKRQSLNLNNLCNVLKLEIECCFRITNTYKIIKNYKLNLFESNNIFAEFNKNKFIFSCVVNLIIYIRIQNSFSEICSINLSKELNSMNSVRTLHIDYFTCNVNLPMFKYVDLLKIVC